ncbi:hypothetical protein AAW01_11115 [Aurantiacibacter gangjinensis]|uniref:Uncharacterized protein n=1 Tax=Aurantiacibacter gangjinensis TaxID=502682 RepID=A0A0G9MMQ6_9SPHN|nr:hypothetical protein AAW01_11115 [Aurantiacibacter gangjinensis]
MATKPDHDLTSRLLLEAACLMEDTTPLLIRIWPDDADSQNKRIDHLCEVTEALSAFAAAARANHIARSRSSHEDS